MIWTPSRSKSAAKWLRSASAAMRVRTKIARSASSQAQPVTAIFLVVDEGSDPPMMEVLGLKASEASQILDPTLGVQSARSDGGGLRALVARYLDRRGGKPQPASAPLSAASFDLEDLALAREAAA
jgi:hypothetical protein